MSTATTPANPGQPEDPALDADKDRGMPAATPDSQRRSKVAIAGVLAACLLIAVAATVGALRGLPKVCGEQLATLATAANPDALVVRVCEPMPVTDPRALLFFLAIFLLLLPLFSEVEVAGLFKMKKEVAEVGRTVAGLNDTVRDTRAQISEMTATLVSTASSQAKSDSSARVEVTVTAREEATGAAQTEAALSERVKVSTGSYAQAAFLAGIAGLRTLPPQDRRPTAVLCFTTTGDRQIPLNPSKGAVPAALEQAAVDVLNQDDDPGAVYLTAGELAGELVIMAPAESESGAVGAVAVFYGKPTPGLERADIIVRTADVWNIAGAYARLLADLIGEQGIPNGFVDTEVGQ